MAQCPVALDNFAEVLTGEKKGRRAPAFFQASSDYLFVDSPLTSTSTRRFGARHSISAFWFF